MWTLNPHCAGRDAFPSPRRRALRRGQQALRRAQIPGIATLAERAVRYALRLSSEVIAVHLTRLEGPDGEEDAKRLRRRWEQSQQFSFWLSVRQTTAVAGHHRSRTPWERGHLGRFRSRRDACAPRLIHKNSYGNALGVDHSRHAGPQGAQRPHAVERIEFISIVVCCASHERRHHRWPVYGSPMCRLAPQHAWM